MLATSKGLDRGLRLVMRDVRPRTYDSHLYNVKIFREWLQKHHHSTLHGPIDKVDRLLLEEFLYYLAHDRIKWEGRRKAEEKGLSQHAINNHIDTLRAIFRRLEEEEYINHNPTKNIKTTKVATNIQPLSPEEFRSMLEQPTSKPLLA